MKLLQRVNPDLLECVLPDAFWEAIPDFCDYMLKCKLICFKLPKAKLHEAASEMKEVCESDHFDMFVMENGDWLLFTDNHNKEVFMIFCE